MGERLGIVRCLITGVKACRHQESQTELHNVQNTIDNKNLQIDELTNKVLILEDKLQHYVTENENLTSQLQQVTLQKEQAVKHANELCLRGHTRDEELLSVKQTVEKLQAEVHQYHSVRAI